MAHYLDEIDQEILSILQENGRITMKELSKMIHLTAPSVADRVAWLEDNGIICGYGAKINPSAMGLKVAATIVVMYHKGKKQGFLKFIQEENEIVTADEIPGKSDVLLRVYSPDMEHFLALVSRIRTYGETDCYFHMEHYKSIPMLPLIDEKPNL